MPDDFNSPSTPLPLKNKIIFIAGGVVILIIIAVVVGLLVNKPSPSPSPSPSPGGQLPFMDEVNWQIYDNAKYGYSFKYPKDWYLDVLQADKDFNQSGIGGQLMLFSDQDVLALLKSDNPPSDLATLSLVIQKVSVQTSVEQFIKDKKYSTPYSQANVKFGGLSGEQMFFIHTRDKKQVVTIETVLKKADQIFVFSWNSFASNKYQLPENIRLIHDQILKSFSVK